MLNITVSNLEDPRSWDKELLPEQKEEVDRLLKNKDFICKYARRIDDSHFIYCELACQKTINSDGKCKLTLIPDETSAQIGAQLSIDSLVRLCTIEASSFCPELRLTQENL